MKSQAAFELSRIRKITWLGLLGNIVLFAVKLLAGLLGRSQAITADAVHSLSDLGTDIGVLLGARYWLEPADKEHPYGHARIETMVSFMIGAVLAMTGGTMAYHAVATLHRHHDRSPSAAVLIVALASVVVKEILYRWTLAEAKSVGSSALRANAWHHRSDAFSSVAVICAVGGAVLFKTWGFLDHVGAVVVSFFILQAAWGIVVPAFQQLVDHGADGEERARVRELTLAIPGVCGIHGLRSRLSGKDLYIDLHVLVHGGLSVKEGHDIASRVKRMILARIHNVRDVVVHVEPWEEEGTALAPDDRERTS